MADTVETPVTFDQAAVDKLVGKARVEGHSSGLKDALKAAGVETLDALTGVVTEHKTLKAATLTEADKQAQALKDANAALAAKDASVATVELENKQLKLEKEAGKVGKELGVDPVKADQILKLIGVSAATYDPAKAAELKAQFETFLAAPDNAHFKAEASTTISGGSRTPASTTPAGKAKNKFDELLSMAKAGL